MGGERSWPYGWRQALLKPGGRSCWGGGVCECARVRRWVLVRSKRD